MGDQEACSKASSHRSVPQRDAQILHQAIYTTLTSGCTEEATTTMFIPSTPVMQTELASTASETPQIYI